MKNLKRLLIPVTCLLLCAVMALPAYAFSPSDPDASPLEEFFGNLTMIIIVLFFAALQYIVPILIILAILIVVVVVVAFFAVRAFRKRYRIVKVRTTPKTEDEAENITEDKPE